MASSDEQNCLSSIWSQLNTTETCIDSGLYNATSPFISETDHSYHGMQKRPSADSSPQMESASKRSRYGPRICALDLPEWESNRSKIEELYKSHTLQDTRDIMSKEHGFHQSEKIYKEKLSEWGIFKYMPTSTAQWVLEHDKKMRAEGKRMAYEFGGRNVNMAEVRRKAKRAKIRLPSGSNSEEDIPQNVVIRTLPSSAEADIPSNDSATASPDPVSTNTAQTTETSFTPPNHYSRPTADQPRVRWGTYSYGDLYELYYGAIDSHDPRNHYNIEDATIKFHLALQGFNYLFSPTDLKTRGAAYNLAECYAELGRRDDFRAVLEWLGKELVGYPDNEALVNAHIVRVTRLFRTYGSPKEGMVLLYHSLMDATPDSSSYSPSPRSSSRPLLSPFIGDNTATLAGNSARSSPSTSGVIVPENEEISDFGPGTDARWYQLLLERQGLKRSIMAQQEQAKSNPTATQFYQTLLEVFERQNRKRVMMQDPSDEQVQLLEQDNMEIDGGLKFGRGLVK